MKKRNRFLSVLLSVTLVVSGLTVPAGAATVADEIAVMQEENLSQIAEETQDTEAIVELMQTEEAVTATEAQNEEVTETEAQDTESAVEQAQPLEADELQEAEVISEEEDLSVETVAETDSSTLDISAEGILVGYTGSANELDLTKLVGEGTILAIGGSVQTTQTIHGTKYMASYCYTPFSGNTTLTKIVIPKSCVTIFGNSACGAFQGCSALISVEFEAGSELTSINEKAFADCEQLTSIKLEDTKLETIGERAFRDTTKLLTVTFPDTCKELGDYAFSNSGLTKYQVASAASRLETIGNYAFSNCTNMVSIDIPDSVTTIGNYAFNDLGSLKTININAETSKLSSIGEYAFCDCTSLAEVTLPNALESMGKLAFWRCTSLVDVKNSANTKLVTVPQSAFNNCSALKSFALPASLVSIAGYAFDGCISMVSVDIPEGSKLTTIGDLAFYNCKALKKIQLPENKTIGSIGDEAFRFNDALGEIVLGSNFTSIGDEAFQYCKNLSVVSFGENSQLASIGADAFYGCSSLCNITIPANVSTIGASAFGAINDSGDYGYITFENPDVTLAETAFDNSEKLVLIAEPEGSVQTYADETRKNILFNRFSDSIRVKTQPKKTAYFVGEALNTDGLEVEAEYTSETEPVSGVVDCAQCQFTGYDANKIGKQTVTVSYAKRKDNFDVAVYYDLANKTSATVTGCVYTGEDGCASYQLTNQLTKDVLTEGEDFTVSYKEDDRVDVGTYTVIFTGIGNYKGTLEKTYQVTPASIRSATFKVLPVSYNGKEQTFIPTVSYNGLAVPADQVSFRDNVQTNAGEYSMQVTGKGNFTGYAWVDYEIEPVDISSVSVNGIVDMPYDGEEKEQKLNLWFGDKFNKLVEGVDYRVQYIDNVEVGTATLRISAITGGNYKGSIEKTFKITGSVNPNPEPTPTPEPEPTPTPTPDPTPTPVSVTNSKANYKVSGSGVTFVSPKKKTTKVTVPDTVKGSDKKSYPVKTISSKAFVNNKVVKEVTIGKNVTKIGANAFKGSKKLTKLIIKSTKLTKKGVKNALKGSSVKTVYVPAKKYNAYKKIFTKGNCGKKVTVKKLK